MTKKSKVEKSVVSEESKVEEPVVSEESKVEKNKKKEVAEEFFAGKLVLKKYENADGKFVVLEGGETIKL